MAGENGEQHSSPASAGGTRTRSASTSTRHSIPVLSPPCPQMFPGPVVYVPGVLRAGPGNRPVFVPSPATNLPVYYHGQETLSPLSVASSSTGSHSAVSPVVVSPLSPPEQQLQVDTRLHADSQRGYEARAERVEPEAKSGPGPGPGPGPGQEPESVLEARREKKGVSRRRKGWRPKWLQRWVLCVFGLWFVVLLGVVEGLASVSNRDGSLAVDPGPASPYLWIVGLTAVFAITSALWDRVTYQAMRFMPWIQMAREPSEAERSIALDYHSHRFLLSAMMAALRNRHFLVAGSGAVTLILRLLTVLSAGLIFLNGASVTSVVPVSVGDVFSPDNLLTNPSPDRVPTAAYKLLEAMVNENASAPFGFAGSTAFQTFTRPTGRDILNVTVDGFWADVECVPATIDAKLIISEDDGILSLNITSRSRLCEQGDTDTQVLPTGELGQGVARERLLYFGGQGGTWCGPGGEGMFSLAYYTVGETGLDRGIGAHCRPRYRLGKASITTTEHKIDIKRMDSLASSPVDWALTRTVDGMWAMNLPNSNRTIVTSTVAHLGPDAYARDATNVIKVPDPIRMGSHLEGGKAPERMEELDSETLAWAVAGFYRHLSPLVAHTELRKQVASTAEGELITTKARLMVHPVFSHIMAVILAAAALVAAISAAVLHRGAVYPPNSPETILGMALNLMNSPKLLQKLSGTGQLSLAQTASIAYGTYRAVQKPTDRATPPIFSISCASESSEPPSPAPDIEPESGDAESLHRPFYLQLLPRAVVLVFLVAIITVLVVLLRASQNHIPPGLADLDYDAATHTHYLWTSIPTLFAVLISTFFSAVDTHVRALSGFLFLAAGTGHGQGTATAKRLHTRLADRTALSALVAAIRAGAWAAVVSAGTALLAGCITIASGAVFAFVLDPNSSGTSGPGRVVVNSPAAIIVMGLLLVVVLMTAGVAPLLGRLFPRRVAPKAPGSILSMASLLADSNVFGELRQCQRGHMTESEVETLFAGKRFRMGWFKREQRMVYTVGVEDRF